MALPTKPLLDRSKAGVWLDENRRAIVRASVFSSPDIRAVQNERGLTLFLNRPGGGGAASVRQYLLTDASSGDYFVARALYVSVDVSSPSSLPSLTIGATDNYIAKPFHLRRSKFDRATLNKATPANIGTPSEITYDLTVEAWNGTTFSSSTMRLSFEYKSANYRIATDETDPSPSNWVTEKQTIIPRFVPAVLTTPAPEAEDQTITTATVSPTILYAVKCSGLGVIRPVDPDDPEGDQVPVTLLALNDGWAWMKSTA